MFGYPIYAVNNSARAKYNQSINDRNRDKHKIHSEIEWNSSILKHLKNGNLLFINQIILRQAT